MSRIYSIGNTRITSLEIPDNEDVCIIVSVNPEKEGKVLRECKKIIFFEYNDSFPFKLNYKDPKRVGNDRVAFATFAFFENIYPSYLLDAGTFITVDFFDGKVLYPISTIPGFKTQLKTLKYAFNLRNLELKKPDKKFPESPEESLYNGIFGIVGLGINAILKEDAQIVITGGDATVLYDLIKQGVVVKNATLIGAYISYKNGLI